MLEIKFSIDPHRVYELMADDIQTWVEMMPKEMQTKPLVGLAASSGKTFTPEDLVREVRSGTTLGVKLVEQAISLAAGGVFQQMLKEQG